MSIRRKWDVSSKETKKKCIDDIVAQLEDLQGGSIGIIAAGEILDIVAQTIGPDIYNQGIDDAKKLLATRFADIEIDVDLLRQS